MNRKFRYLYLRNLLKSMPVVLLGVILPMNSEYFCTLKHQHQLTRYSNQNNLMLYEKFNQN
jgi:hypothetical protein